MKSVLISIHPNHVQNILSGDKLFEYRKIFPLKGVTHLVIYATVPVGAVVAVAEIDQILEGSPSCIWEKTKHAGGITRQFYRDYFRDRKRAFAIKVGHVRSFAEPIDPIKILGVAIPQSYIYLENEKLRKILKRECLPTAL